MTTRYRILDADSGSWIFACFERRERMGYSKIARFDPEGLSVVRNSVSRIHRPASRNYQVPSASSVVTFFARSPASRGRAWRSALGRSDPTRIRV